MIYKHMLVYLVVFISLTLRQSMTIKSQVTYLEYLRAEVQSCRGCALNRLPEVKAFIYDDLPKYSKWASFNPIPGALPDLVLFNKKNQEVDRISLSSLSRNDCNNLMNEYNSKMTMNLNKNRLAGEEEKSEL